MTSSAEAEDLNVMCGMAATDLEAHLHEATQLLLLQLQQAPDSALLLRCAMDYTLPPSPATSPLLTRVVEREAESGPRGAAYDVGDVAEARATVHVAVGFCMKQLVGMLQTYIITWERQQRPPPPAAAPLDNLRYNGRAFLTQSFVAHHAHLNTLLLCALPAHAVLWHQRRERVEQQRQQPGCAALAILVGELVLTSFLVSAFYKVQEVWVYRQWVLQQLLPLAGQRSGDWWAVLRQHDDVHFFFAAEKHPLNYNAWTYRRARGRAELAAANEGPSEEWEDILRRECRTVLRFLELNNGDSSAVGYLCFLLETAAAATTTTNTATHERLAVELWRRLFASTQAQLRLHAHRGHECVWHLRLFLVRWALQHRTWVHTGWTVADELEWVGVYVAHAAAADVGRGPLLLAPLSTVGPPRQEDWVHCSGSGAWTSYLAARYGQQLVELLLRRVK